MKCAVIYFSQTGNTEKIARAIAKGAAKAADQCDLLTLKEANPRRLYRYDLIGLGAPVIGFVEPVNVMAFIKDIKFMGGKHAFVFDTHATRGEFFFPSIVPKLKRKGMTVVGMFDSYAANFMSGSGDKCPTAGHPDAIELKDAAAFGSEVVELSRRIYKGEKGLVPGYPVWAEKNVGKYLTERQAREQELGMPKDVAMRIRPRLLWDRGKCKFPKCRLCMENCPMDGIDVTMKMPVIGKPCMGCGFCLKICPAGALRMERPMMGGGAIPPEASKAMFEEFYLKSLAKAEAEGRFRRHIRIEDMEMGGGPPKGPEKHPQWIIGKGPAK